MLTGRPRLPERPTWPQHRVLDLDLAWGVLRPLWGTNSWHGSQGGVTLGTGRDDPHIYTPLERLVDTGWAERTGDRPKRYRFADGDDTGGGTACRARSRSTVAVTRARHPTRSAPSGARARGEVPDRGSTSPPDDNLLCMIDESPLPASSG
jgi:hypothetical protein